MLTAIREEQLAEKERQIELFRAEQQIRDEKRRLEIKEAYEALQSDINDLIARRLFVWDDKQNGIVLNIPHAIVNYHFDVHHDQLFEDFKTWLLRNGLSFFKINHTNTSNMTMTPTIVIRPLL